MSCDLISILLGSRLLTFQRQLKRFSGTELFFGHQYKCTSMCRHSISVWKALRDSSPTIQPLQEPFPWHPSRFLSNHYQIPPAAMKHRTRRCGPPQVQWDCPRDIASLHKIVKCYFAPWIAFTHVICLSPTITLECKYLAKIFISQRLSDLLKAIWLVYGSLIWHNFHYGLRMVA